MKSIKQSFPLACEVQLLYHDDKAYNIAITEVSHPPFSTWIFEMKNPEKLAWIAANNGLPYPILFLRISLVADYFDYHFNYWKPRGDSGYLDTDCGRESNGHWIDYLGGINSILQQSEFEYETEGLARQKISCVQMRDYCSIPDDDPRWEIDDFGPPLEPADIHECLFGRM